MDWRESQAHFETTVEALIQRIWSKRDDGVAHVVDGRGGDEGLDVFVRDDGDVIHHVYQLKFFPEGMSGGWRDTRRRQVRVSFESVAGLEGLEVWTLVIPRNPTVRELKSILALRRGRNLILRVWGPAELDQEIARHPDLLASATRKPLVEALREAGQESAALAGPHDLAVRALKLSERANERSMYWGVDVSIARGAVTQTLFAKHPDAQLREPISLEFSPSFGNKHGSLKRDFETMLDYGAPKSISLPPEVVGAVKVTGPEWIADESSGYGILISQPTLDTEVPSELRIVTSRGAVLASLPGVISDFSQGRRGFTLSSSYQGLDMVVTAASHDHEAGAQFKTQFAGIRASAVQSVLKVMDLIGAGEFVEILAQGKLILKFGHPTRPPAVVLPSTPPDLYELVDDLALLEREYGVAFLIPETLTPLQRIDVRAVRMLTEGRVTTSPRLAKLTATLSGDAIDSVVETLSSPQAITTSMPEYVFDVLGIPIPLGTLRTYHPSVQAEDAPGHIAAVRAGAGDGRKVVFRSADGSPTRLWLEERWKDPNAPLIPEPWQVEGIGEEPGLQVGGADDPKPS